ncbi:hypothetical protein [Pseudokineococcus sp. 1T1Z-3]|uniref:hypothetical protein n=1 Tax=Pseudokineococcus sp. 1T1Z-3 TaxID=3132745 RepID=UPI0030960355
MPTTRRTIRLDVETAVLRLAAVLVLLLVPVALGGWVLLAGQDSQTALVLGVALVLLGAVPFAVLLARLIANVHLDVQTSGDQDGEDA